MTTDTMIKSEAIDLINILHAHDLIKNKSELVEKVEAQYDGILKIQ